MSLTATISSRTSRSVAARKKLRPMRPKPLIAMRVGMPGSPSSGAGPFDPAENYRRDVLRRCGGGRAATQRRTGSGSARGRTRSPPRQSNAVRRPVVVAPPDRRPARRRGAGARPGSAWPAAARPAPRAPAARRPGCSSRRRAAACSGSGSASSSPAASRRSMAASWRRVAATCRSRFAASQLVIRLARSLARATTSASASRRRRVVGADAGQQVGDGVEPLAVGGGVAAAIAHGERDAVGAREAGQELRAARRRACGSRGGPAAAAADTEPAARNAPRR